MVILVMNMKEKEEEEGATVEEGAKKNGVNYGGSMDTLHETKMEYTAKRLHTRKTMSTVFFILQCSEGDIPGEIGTDAGRKVEEGSQFHFIN